MAEPQVVTPPKAIRLTIEWRPQAGQMAVEWPPVDEVIKFGMLETAKSMLIEQRVKVSSANGGGLAGSGILVPRSMM